MIWEVLIQQNIISIVQAASSKKFASNHSRITIDFIFSGCVPVQNLAFAKTHKTGSTTLQNIILRYGFLRDLTFAIPIKRGWMFNQSIQFNANYLVRHYINNPSHMFNIFASHSKWNKKQVQKLVGIDAKFITILRDPIDVFESGFVYFNFEKQLEMDINEYVERVFPFERSYQAVFGKNQLLYNLGKYFFNLVFK